MAMATSLCWLHSSSLSATMASPIQDPGLSSKPYVDPTPLPTDVPKVHELGTTSAPLKSAAFFIGAYCKEYNGAPLHSVPNTNSHALVHDMLLCAI